MKKAYIIRIKGYFYADYSVLAENEDEAKDKALADMVDDIGNPTIIDYFNITPTEERVVSELSKEDLLKLPKNELKKHIEEIDIFKELMESK